MLRLQNKALIALEPVEKEELQISDFSIVITTFEARFDSYALNLIRTLREVTDVPITLVINGNVKSLTNSRKLQNFLLEISRFPQIYPMTFQSFQGCAKMWNSGILNSSSDTVLVLNDDVSLLAEHFNSDMSAALSMLPTTNVLTLNSSWSHFLINRTAVSDYGWFDERLIGIGNEDGEYAERFTRLTGKYIPTLEVDTFINISDSSRDEGVMSTESKYSLFNSILNEVRSVNPDLFSILDPYPVNKWQREMYEFLSVGEVEPIKKAIKNGLRK